MKLILAQPSVKRFQWELEVLLTNISKWVKPEDVILLFSKPHDNDDTVPPYLHDKYGVQCFVYEDKRLDKRYIPSIRPYLWYRYLLEDKSREHETYFYIDSDIIFREWPRIEELGCNWNTVVGSDCDSYIGLDYILGCTNGAAIAEKMAQVCGITVDQMRGVPGIGAQIIISNPTAEFWLRSYRDSIRLYDYLLTLNTTLQKWTAEMWAQLWGWVRDGRALLMPHEMDFCRPTDDISEWNKVKIMHNAGVTAPGKMFFKGNYVSRMPFDEDFSEIDQSKVSAEYVRAIQKVVQ